MPFPSLVPRLSSKEERRVEEGYLFYVLDYESRPCSSIIAIGVQVIDLLFLNNYIPKFHSHEHTVISLYYLGLSHIRYVMLALHACPGLVHRGGYGGQVVVLT